MNKYISAIVLSTVGLSAAAEGMLSKGKFDVGVAVGAGIGNTKETLMISDDNPSISRYKYTLKGSGPLAGVTAGYTIDKMKNVFGVSLAYYKDFYTSRNSGVQQDLLGSYDNQAKRDLRRKYTLELAGKFGRMITEDILLYGKLGVVRSAFREQYGDTPIDLRHNVNGWGGVAGIGAQKSYDAVKVGLAYDYQYYQRLGTTMGYSVGTPVSVNYKNKTKFRPQYHNIYLTISKSF